MASASHGGTFFNVQMDYDLFADDFCSPEDDPIMGEDKVSDGDI